MARTRGCRTSTRPALTPEERAQRLAQAREQLQAGVDNLMTAEGWEQMIRSRAWLRRYSFHNLVMILAQCPQATDVRPLSEWKELGYGYMRKGTHKIKIWKPVFRKIDDETPAPEGVRLTGFMLVPVVDVSQLQDAPAAAVVPCRPVELTGAAPTGLWEGVAAQVRALGFTVERGDCGSAYGMTLFGRERRVVVRVGAEPAQAVKTLTHELAHILCGHEHRAAPRELREVEAESVACIVSAVCGLDTLSYSVPYVAVWAGDRAQVEESAERVLRVADAIIEHLQAHVPTREVDLERCAG